MFLYREKLYESLTVNHYNLSHSRYEGVFLLIKAGYRLRNH